MYDGTLTIDTQFNTKAFNVGVADLVRGLRGLALTATGVVLGILGIKSVKAVAVLAAEFSRLKQAAQAVGQMYGFTSQESKKLIDDLVAQGVQTDVASRAYINFAKEGLDAHLLPSLARGAQNLNALADSGASSSEVLNGLLTGILQLDATMLRNRGVVVDLGAAYVNFAKTNNLSVASLTIQQKRQAALIATIEKLKGVTGLYELSQRTAAGQMSSNVRIMNEFKSVIGGGLQDAFFNLIKSFNDLIKALTVAFKEGGKLYNLWLTLSAIATLLSRAIRGLFEAIAKWLGAEPSTTKAATNTASGMNDMIEGAEGAADAQDTLGEALQDSAKKAQGALAAFDQLNVLQQPDENKKPAVPEVGLAALQEVDLTQIEDPLKKIQEAADKLQTKLRELFAPFLKGLEDIKQKLKPLIDLFITGLGWVWENILKPFGQWAIDSFLPVFFDLLSISLRVLTDVLTALQPVFQWLWEKILKPLANVVGQLILESIQGWTMALNDLATWFEAHPNLFADFGHGAEGVVEFIREKFGNLGEFFIIIFQAIGDTIQTRFEFIKGFFKAFLEYLIGGIQFIKGVLSGDWEKAWEGLTNIFKGIVDGWSAIFKGAANSVLDTMRAWLRLLTLGLNMVIDALNTIAVTIPDWVPIYGGRSFGVNLNHIPSPNIPHLARGAVIPPNAQFAAILGDQKNGRNLEAPEGLIRDIIRQEVSGINSDVNINFTGTGADIVRMLKPHMEREAVRVGKSLIASGVVK